MTDEASRESAGRTPVKTVEARETTELLGEIRALDFQRYAIAVGDLNPIYFDEQAARDAGYAGIVAPPNFITSIIEWGLGALEHEMRDDGNPRDAIARKLIGLDPEDLLGLRMMGGGNEIELGQEVRPGDIVTATRRLVDAYEKPSKMAQLLFAVHETTYVNQHGAILAVCRETNIGARSE
jgi:acyl dehydratase